VGHSKRNCKKYHIRKPIERANTTAQEGFQPEDFGFMVTEHDDAAALVAADESPLTLVIDSGATSHYNPRRGHFDDMREVQSSVTLADSTTVPIQGVGTVGKLKDVKFVPDLSVGLVSVAKLTDEGHAVLFTKTGAYALPASNLKPVDKSSLVRLGERKGNLYVHEKRIVSDNKVYAASANKPSNIEAYLWHSRVGHRSLRLLAASAKAGNITGVPELKTSADICKVCAHANTTHKPHPKSTGHATTRPLELVHLDIVSQSVPSAAGKRYVMVFKDDFTNMAWTVSLSKRSNALDAFKYWRETVETELAIYQQDITLERVRTRSLRTDNDGAFTSSSFEAYCRKTGIFHQHTVPHEHAMAGNAERMIGVLGNMARAMVLQSGLELYWDFAYAAAAHVHNLHPCTANADNQSPWFLWTGLKPDVSHLRVFGSECFVSRVPDVERPRGRKLEPRAIPGVFLGYEKLSTGYLVLTDDGRILCRRSIRFHERPLVAPDGLSAPEAAKLRGPEETPPADASTPPPSSLSALMVQDASSLESISPYREYVFTVALAQDVVIPTTYAQAMNSPQSEHWKKAIEDEIQSLKDNGVFVVVPDDTVPADRRCITAVWVFGVKQKPDGTISRYKARLCGRGFLQVRGKDFNETFAPVAKMTTVRLLFALAAALNLEIDHMDIKTAFLHGILDAEIFMHAPPGFDLPPGMLLKLIKAIYGLRQASRVWNLRLHEVLTEFGFERCPVDPCLYYHPVHRVYLLIYVDDLFLLRPSSFDRQILVDFLTSSGLTVGSVETLKYFIGLEVTRERSSNLIKVHQRRYVLDILARFGMSECNSARTPMVEKNCAWSTSDELDDEAATFYRNIVGALLFLSLASRPDIEYAVIRMTQHMKKPNAQAMQAAKRCLRYLKGTTDVGLVYSGSTMELVGQCDASWGNDLDTRRSMSGFFFSINGGAISWRARLQRTVALSTVEAEYMTYSEVTKEALWLRQLFKFLGIDIVGPTSIFNDNNGALRLSRDSVHHSRTKHIDIRYHFVRCHIDKAVVFKHMPSIDLTADILTKALGPNKFDLHATTILQGV